MLEYGWYREMIKHKNELQTRREAIHLLKHKLLEVALELLLCLITLHANCKVDNKRNKETN